MLFLHVKNNVKSEVRLNYNKSAIKGSSMMRLRVVLFHMRPCSIYEAGWTNGVQELEQES